MPSVGASNLTQVPLASTLLVTPLAFFKPVPLKLFFVQYFAALKLTIAPLIKSSAGFDAIVWLPEKFIRNLIFV